MNHTVGLLLGVVFAAVGGELFIRGSVGLAHWLRVPPGIVGATVAAFATSSPELSVSLSAAAAGDPQIALGDALGSNVVNVGLILGVALLMKGIQGSRGALKRDFPVALLVPILTAALALDGRISRVDAAVMWVVFAAWLGATVVEARKERNAAEDVLGEPKRGRAIAESAIGLAFLFVAGKLIVFGARGIALKYGMGEFVVGATIVAVGTSIPELATTLVARFRGHDEIGLGTVLGSNIFNGVFIVPAAAMIRPIPVDGRSAAAALGVGLLALLFVFPPRSGYVGRARGGLLLALYAAYLAIIIRAH